MSKHKNQLSESRIRCTSKRPNDLIDVHFRDAWLQPPASFNQEKPHLPFLGLGEARQHNRHIQHSQQFMPGVEDRNCDRTKVGLSFAARCHPSASTESGRLRIGGNGVVRLENSACRSNEQSVTTSFEQVVANRTG
jgi:hypothetical protein